MTKRSDKKIIEFIAKSPLQSFASMLDALRYLDGQSIPNELEYELFDDALGDNENQRVKIRIPNLPGIAANAFWNFIEHAKSHHMLRRRSCCRRNFLNDWDDIVSYEVTPAGHELLRILEAIDSIRG